MQGTIVVADKSSTVRRMVEIALARHPFKLEFAADGAGAMQAVGAHGPLVAIVDPDLPGGGYDVAQSIKSDPATRGVKVLMLAGRNRHYDAARAQRAGVDGHLTKPFQTQELVAKVFEAIGQAVPDAGLFRTSLGNIPLARKPAASAPPAPRPRRWPPRRAAAEPAAPVAPPAPPAPPPRTAAGAGNPFGGTSPFETEAPTRQFERPADEAPVAAAAVQAATSRITGDAGLAGALEGASREVVERIAWEVIPQLAEAILKEEIARVVRERMTA
ncbi:MAG: response regulator [Myxococcales bacterium]|nr:response regulator [Myxococcales bacterium]